MVPNSFANYFLAMAGAGAALIGLLFVAVAINPERTLGHGASPPRRGVASGAFTALVNAFFVSTAALVPAINMGYLTFLLGASGLANSIWRNTRLQHGPWRMRRPAQMGLPQWLLVIVGTQMLPFILYAGESALAVVFLLHPGWELPVEVLTYVLLGIYGVGLIRSWELLGGTASGLSWLNHPGSDANDLNNISDVRNLDDVKPSASTAHGGEVGQQLRRYRSVR